MRVVAVTIVRNALGGLDSPTRGNRMRIYAESTGAVSFAARYAPRVIDYDGLAPDWASSERPGPAPLLAGKGRPLKTMAFSLMLADPDVDPPQTEAITAILLLCQTRERVIVRYGPTESGLWR